MTKAFTREIALQCSVEHAFRVFTEQVDLWWPKSHRKFADSVLQMNLAEAGNLTETSSGGESWVIAHVLDWNPPAGLSLSWYPGSADAPTHVEIGFSQTGDSTLVRIVHSAPSGKAEEIWPTRVALFEKGWGLILPAFAACASAS